MFEFCLKDCLVHGSVAVATDYVSLQQLPKNFTLPTQALDSSAVSSPDILAADEVRSRLDRLCV